MNPHGSAPAPLAPTPVDDEGIDFDIDLDDLWGDSDDDLHAECCAKRAFICATPYHPEAVAHRSTAETCEECIELIIGGACGPSWSKHFHCPLIERESGLLTVCQGPKRGDRC